MDPTLEADIEMRWRACVDPMSVGSPGTELEFAL